MMKMRDRWTEGSRVEVVTTAVGGLSLACGRFCYLLLFIFSFWKAHSSDDLRVNLFVFMWFLEIKTFSVLLSIRNLFSSTFTCASLSDLSWHVSVHVPVDCCPHCLLKKFYAIILLYLSFFLMPDISNLLPLMSTVLKDKKPSHHSQG